MGNPSKKSLKRKSFEAEESIDPKRVRGDSHENDENLPLTQPRSSDIPLTAARVMKIYLRNIMCHEALEVNFNPNVNFFIGKNGSGKSAILVSLAIGLGARTSTTQRGDNISQIIKHGCTRASIEITLSNVGPMAYKPEVFGNKIIITRVFGVSPQGTTTSSYKISDAKGKVVSTKKKELNLICSSMNIQPENPISIMNQDNSATFLKKFTDDSRYELFMKATQLDVIKNNYNVAMTESQETKKILDETTEQMRKDQSEIEALEKKIKKLESLDATKKQYEDLKVEMLWATAINEEHVLHNAKKELDNHQTVLEDHLAAQQNKDKRIKEIEEKMTSFKNEILRVDNDTQNSRDMYTSTKDIYQQKKSEISDKQRLLKTRQVEIKRIKGNIQILSNEIEKLESGNSKAEVERNEQQQKLVKCSEELTRVEAMMKTHQVSQQHLEADKLRLDKDEHSLKTQLERKQTYFTKIYNQLTGLQQQSNDPIAVFGRNMSRLLRRIDEEHSKGRFRMKPIGPLGAYIKVKDQSWIPAVENFLTTRTLKSFCADNSQDAKALMHLMKEVFHDEQLPSVLMSKFHNRVHDVRQTCSGTDRYPNLFHSMEITNPVVANALIDQSACETVILIPTSSEAVQMMENAANVPRNCKRAITNKGDLFYPDPNYKTYGGRVQKPKLLQVSTKDVIQHLKDEISTAEREKLQVSNEYRAIRDKIQENADELDKASKKLYSLSAMRRKLITTIATLEDTLIEDNTDCGVYKTEKEELEEQLKSLMEEESRLVEEISKLEDETRKLGAEVNRLRGDVFNRTEKITAINNHIEKLESEKSDLTSNANRMKTKIQNAQEAVRVSEESARNQVGVVAKAIQEAEQLGPRIDTDKTPQQLGYISRNLLNKIRAVETQLGSKEELKNQLEEKRSKTRDVLEFYRKITKVNKRHLRRVEARRHEFNELKTKTSERVRKSFRAILGLRKYDGNLTIDHANKKLLLEVIPRNKSQRDVVTDINTLSGGERSYSTVAFVLSLWECTTVPFYFLDEFDVFMDKVNRRITMNLLKYHAEEHPEKQFAFFTPLDASIIEANDFMTIHQMAPPERGNETQSTS